MFTYSGTSFKIIDLFVSKFYMLLINNYQRDFFTNRGAFVEDFNFLTF